MTSGGHEIDRFQVWKAIQEVDQRWGLVTILMAIEATERTGAGRKSNANFGDAAELRDGFISFALESLAVF